MDNYYATCNANVHRGAHALASRATELYEDARSSVQAFIHADRREEIILTRGATEAINIVVRSYGDAFLKAGDEVRKDA